MDCRPPVAVVGLACVLALASTASCDRPPRARDATPPAAARGAIVGGVSDPGHPAVGAVILGRGTCTGVLVASRVVLTAAHCLADGGDAVAFVTGDSAFGPQQDIALRLPHPDYERRVEDGHEVAWHDVAALVLQAPAPVAPLPWSRALPGDLAGRTVAMVGFGESGDGPSGVKRLGHVVVDRVTAHGFWNLVLAGDPQNACLGDSGAPVLLPDDGGGGAPEEVVIGLVSSGDSTCTRHAYSIRLDVEASFVDAVLAQWGDDVPDERPADDGSPDEGTDPVPDDPETDPGGGPPVPDPVPPQDVDRPDDPGEAESGNALGDTGGVPDAIVPETTGMESLSAGCSAISPPADASPLAPLVVLAALALRAIPPRPPSSMRRSRSGIHP